MKKLSIKINITPHPISWILALFRHPSTSRRGATHVVFGEVTSRRGILKFATALFLCLLITTAVLAAGRCVPCKLNHYCVDGLRYQCPPNTPVTQGTGAGALNECLTCTQRNGNSANPIYDDLVGDCVSCYEYDSLMPYWDGTTCSVCPSGTLWNDESLTCKEVEYTCAFEIPHGDGTLCLVESVDYTAYESISPQSAEEETAEFKSKYGIVNTSTLYPDY